MSSTQRFLVAAYQAVGAGEYFRWGPVGERLGYTEERAGELVRSLDERKLVILLLEGNARLLTAGREVAMRLDRGR
jgi:hypothetical protein